MASEQPAVISPEAQARARLKARLLTVDFLEAFPWRFSKKQIQALEEFATKRITEALAAERQQQRAETVEIVMRILKRESECWPPFGSGGTARTILARVGEVIAALDAAVPGAREVTDGE